MEYIDRIAPVEANLKHKSILLLGPRQTGKTTLLHKQIRFDKTFNLLHADTFARLSHDPSFIRKSLRNSDKVILIDEVQKLPLLLDEVHAIIEEKKIRFALTGSSARKLRKAYTSLLGGRLRINYLYPLVFPEMKKFDLNKVLLLGSIPSIFLSSEPMQDLKDYVGTYLKEEIMAEAMVRKIDSFSRFLKIASISNTKQLNYESIGNDSGVPPRTVREYFHILEDTLIGKIVYPKEAKSNRKLSTKAKFYFFDTGVVNALMDIKSISAATEHFGALFEQFIFNEIKAYLSYRGKLESDTIAFWRTQKGEYEVDFILNEEIAIEVKSTKKVNSSHLKSIKVLKSEAKFKSYFLISLDSLEQEEDAIQIMHYQNFLRMLWEGEII